MNILIKNLLFTVLIPGTMGIYLPYYLGSTHAGARGWWNWPGIVLLLAGFWIVLLCIWDFATRGQGTPFPLDPPKDLVTGRLYRLTRNPMYVGVLLAVVGWALWFSSGLVLLYGLVLGLAFYVFVVFVEEPTLKKQFGSTYEEYCRKVPRWF